MQKGTDFRDILQSSSPGNLSGRNLTWGKAVCSMCLVGLTCFPALAQDIPKAEVFGGSSWAGGNFHGWNASVTGNVTKRFGIVADFSGHYGNELEGPILVKK